ncbi:MAG: radical SAM protein, partial [Methanomassiliicoccales archaeon]
MKSAGKLPIHIGWQCTNACNLKCIHCYASAGNISPYELDTQEAKNLIGSISELGSTSIVFTGGEPMMRKDLFDLVGYASDRGLHVIIATNGTMIDERSAELFKELEVAIAINYPAVDE